MTRKDTKNMRTVCKAPEFTHPRNVEDFMGFGPPKRSAAKTRLGDLDLAEKENISEAPGNRKFTKLVKSVGKSPEQYPDYDDEEDGY